MSVLCSKWLFGKIEGVTKSKDGRVRKVDVGYRYDSEQGTREFRIVERPARECVRLMNLEDTTLFDEIKAVHDASRLILGEEDVGGVQQDGTVSQSLVTYACNSSVDPEFQLTAVDVGTHARFDACCTSSSCNGVVQIGDGENELQLGEDLDMMFFDIDDDYNDKFNDTCLCLL